MSMKYFLLLIPLLFLASCAPTTPVTRIEKHKALYAKQSKKHKELINKGQITEGMNMDGVFLAWGKPDKQHDVYTNNKHTTAWEYTELKPVVSQSIYGSVGFGKRFYRPHRRIYGGIGYGRGWGYGNHIGIGTNVGYVPSVSATVNFKDRKVTSWETRK